MDMNCEEVRENLGAYALGALDAQMRTRIAQHVGNCPDCRAELVLQQRVAQGLLFTPPARLPPPNIKAQLIAKANAASASARPLAKRSWLQRLMAWLFGSTQTPRWALGAMASLALVVTGLLGFQTYRFAQLNAQYQEAVALLADARAQLVHLDGQKASPNAWATIRYRTDSTIGLMNVGDLPALDEKSYQLWLVDASGKRDSGAVFMTETNGKASYVVVAPRRFESYVRFGVSIEPRGGSPGPTGPAALIGMPK